MATIAGRVVPRFRTAYLGLNHDADLAGLNDDIPAPGPGIGYFLQTDGIVVFERPGGFDTAESNQIGAKYRVSGKQKPQSVGKGVFISANQAKYALDGDGCIPFVVIFPDVQPHDIVLHQSSHSAGGLYTRRPAVNPPAL